MTPRCKTILAEWWLFCTFSSTLTTARSWALVFPPTKISSRRFPARCAVRSSPNKQTSSKSTTITRCIIRLPSPTRKNPKKSLWIPPSIVEQSLLRIHPLLEGSLSNGRIAVWSCGHGFDSPSILIFRRLWHRPAVPRSALRCSADSNSGDREVREGHRCHVAMIPTPTRWPF